MPKGRLKPTLPKKYEMDGGAMLSLQGFMPVIWSDLFVTSRSILSRQAVWPYVIIKSSPISHISCPKSDIFQTSPKNCKFDYFGFLLKETFSPFGLSKLALYGHTGIKPQYLTHLFWLTNREKNCLCFKFPGTLISRIFHNKFFVYREL